ncbi:MAG: glycoside hydrolase family 38 C-terminal domain-containing protein [Tissierellia bacterium]|nr:glycoside hydrolase family 38 C-terminal domain-containing protein [Tissierellia bacterium]
MINYIIAHTHWDREWYFTDKRSVVYSLYDFDELIDFLENNDEFSTFLLDGQTSIINDYISYRPYNKDRIRKLVENNRLVIGPWFTQTDTLVISGESIIRNLLYGIKDSNEYGSYQKIGYLPDSFGMSESLPMIYDNFNLKYAVFRRGISNYLTDNREFIWDSKSGKSIRAFNIYHYGLMAYPPNDIDDKYFDNLIDKLKDFNNHSPYIIFCGEDQKPIRKNLPELIKDSKYNFKIESLENALDSLFENIDNLQSYKGEFTMAQFSRTHKSIFSTRADLKIKNNRLENYLTNIIEPISSIAMKLGIHYENLLIERAWRLLLENAAHDSIGMCNSDKTNEVIEKRYDEAKDLMENLLDITLRKIGDRIDSKGLSFQVYNTLPYMREDIIEGEIYTPYENFKINSNGNDIDYELISIKEDNITLNKSKREIGVNNEKYSNLENYKNLYKAKIRFKDKINSMGYKTYDISKSEDKIYSNNKISNKYFKVELTEDGSLVINGDNKIEKIYFENSGDEGDSYDYSKPSRDLIITKGKVLEKEITNGKYFSELKSTIVQKIPSNLENRQNKKLDVNQKIKINVRLYDKFIKLNVKIKNKAIEHRYRIVTKTKLNKKENFADTQFGTIIRQNKLKEEKIWQEENRDEKPRTIEPMISLCGIGDSEKIAVVTDGVREYQVLEDSSIAMTLYRSVKYLGKANLNDRPGRESGVYKEEDGHKLLDKIIEENYYITQTDKDYDEIHKFAKERLTPLFMYQSGEILDNTNSLVISKSKDKLQKEFSLLEIDSKAIMSVLKKSEEEDFLILRLYNPLVDKKEDYKINYNGKIDYLKADEKTQVEEKEINPEDIITIKLK